MARKRRRLHKRYRNRKRSESAPRANPPLALELLEYIGPGFAGFAATRVMTRMAIVQIARRKPAWAKHAGVIASLASFGAAWWGAHKVKFLEKYAAPITVGAGIAAAMTVLQQYLPKIGWLISDASSDELALPAGATVSQQIAAAQLTPVDDDPNAFVYDERYSAGRYAKDPAAARPAPTSREAAKVAAEDDLLADLNLDESATVTTGWGSTLN